MTIVLADDFVNAGGGHSEADLLSTSIFEAVKDKPVETVKFLTRICERAMQPRVQAWDRYRRKYRRGLYYVSQDGSKNPLYSTNYAFNVVETLKANLTQAMPALTMQPVEDGDTVAANVFTKVLRNELKRANLKGITEVVVQHGALTGTGWYKVWFNPDAFFGKGALALDGVAPEDMLVLPTMLDYRAGDLFIQRLRDVPDYEIKAKYDKDVQGSPERTLVENDRSIGDVDRNMQSIKTYNIYECWIKDPETDTWWITVVAGSTLLKKPYESPYKHNRAPFIPWYDVYDVGADQAYTVGVGEIEQIEMLQDQADALDMRIYKNIKQITGRQRVLNPASGINRNDVDDTPNKVYLCTGRPQDAMMWDAPPSLGADVYLYRERVEDRIQIVSGIFDVTQGKRPSGIQAARAVNALQGAAAKRIQKKTDSLTRAQEDVGYLASSIILQMYDDKRLIRMVAGEQVTILGDYPEGFGLDVMIDDESLEPDEARMLELQKAMWRQQNGIDLVLSDVNPNYDIVASTDSALPEDRGERVQLAADLFRLGAIDRKALLDAVDYPDRDVILKRLGENVTGKTPAEATPENQQMIQQAIAQGSMPPNVPQGRPQGMPGQMPQGAPPMPMR